MNKRIIAIISSLFIFALTIILILAILLGIPSNKKTFSSSELTCSVYDKAIGVGERIYNFYDINDKDANVYFEVSKPGIIFINEEMIEGLSVGEVNVTLFAFNDKNSIKNEFTVKVFEKNYYFDVTTIENCEFDKSSSTFIAKDSYFQFMIEFYDLSNKVMENTNYDIIANDKRTIVDRKINNIIVIVEEDDCIIFSHKNFNASLMLFIKCEFV